MRGEFEREGSLRYIVVKDVVPPRKPAVANYALNALGGYIEKC